MLKNYSAIILRDDMLEGLVSEGYSGAEDGVGYGLVNFSVHYDIGLAGFFMEEFSHRKKHKVKK